MAVPWMSLADGDKYNSVINDFESIFKVESARPADGMKVRMQKSYLQQPSCGKNRAEADTAAHQQSWQPWRLLRTEQF